MLVYQFNDSYFPVIDGVAVTVHNYVTHLNKNNVDCKVATVRYSKNDDEQGIQRIKSVIFPNKLYRWALPDLDFKFKKIIAKDKIDLIHIHSPFLVGRFALKYAKKNNIPTIATFHTKFYYDFLDVTHNEFLAKLLLKYIMVLYNNVDYLWTVNENTKKTLIEYGCTKDKIEIMPNGMDLILPENENKLISKIRKIYKLNRKDNIFLFVGQISNKKNLDKVIEAMVTVIKKSNNSKLLIVGTGPDTERFKKLSQTLKIDDKVFFLGKIADRDILTGIYLTADAFVFPSVYDNAPLTVREAAKCKCVPIVVKDTGSSEKIVDEFNGFLCDEDVKSIASTMLKAIKDKKKLNEIAINASKTIPIAWEDIVKTVQKRYDEIIKEYNKL